MYGNSILDDLKFTLRQDNPVIKIILVNVAVFVLVNLIQLVLYLFQLEPSVFYSFLRWLMVPAHPEVLLYKPWTLITYMFLHEGFFHILFNMLWFYWFGRILMDFLGTKKILPIYLMGGLFGAFVYILSYNFFPVFRQELVNSYALGASAAVLAIVVAAATLVPNYSIHLLFLGAVKLKYIALFSVILDLISIPKGNAGGHIAHLGGALFGFIFIKQLQSGHDWSLWMINLFDKIKSLFTSASRPRVVYRNREQRKQKTTTRATTSKSKQERLDTILDKIAQSGYDSLTKEEKEFLFKVSNEDR